MSNTLLDKKIEANTAIAANAPGASSDPWLLVCVCA